jgi:signal peptidase II
MAAERHTRWLWITLAVVAADRTTKFAIERYTSEDFHRVLVPGFVTLVHSRNPGIAFGMFAESRSNLLTAALVVGASTVIGMLAWILTAGRAGGPRSTAGFALIAGGATGNLIDRLLYRGVTDFFEVHAGSFHWPAFNVADSAIAIGAVLAILDLLRARPLPSEGPAGKEA